MKDEAHTWISYANENLEVSALSLNHGHLNACLQNAQQAVEKFLKSLIIGYDIPYMRTHSIRKLIAILARQEIVPPISEDEMDFMDTIYVPSKYPVYSHCHDPCRIMRYAEKQ